MSSDKDSPLQQKTFFHWVNHQLKSSGEQISQIEELADGVKLSRILKNFGVGRITGVPKHRVQKLENVQVCLAALQTAGLRTDGISADSIVSGQAKPILGLLWMIVSHFHIGNAVDPSQRKAARKALLAWCSSRLDAYKIPISNFGSNLQDGKALCGLLHSLDPTSIDISVIENISAEERVALAFKVAEEYFEIPSVIEPNDVLEGVDESCAMTYIAYFIFASRGQLPNEFSRSRSVSTASSFDVRPTDSKPTSALQSPTTESVGTKSMPESPLKPSPIAESPSKQTPITETKPPTPVPSTAPIPIAPVVSESPSKQSPLNASTPPPRAWPITAPVLTTAVTAKPETVPVESKLTVEETFMDPLSSSPVQRSPLASRSTITVAKPSQSSKPPIKPSEPLDDDLFATPSAKVSTVKTSNFTNSLFADSDAPLFEKDDPFAKVSVPPKPSAAMRSAPQTLPPVSTTSTTGTTATGTGTIQSIDDWLKQDMASNPLSPIAPSSDPVPGRTSAPVTQVQKLKVEEGAVDFLNSSSDSDQYDGYDYRGTKLNGGKTEYSSGSSIPVPLSRSQSSGALKPSSVTRAVSDDSPLFPDAPSPARSPVVQFNHHESSLPATIGLPSALTEAGPYRPSDASSLTGDDFLDRSMASDGVSPADGLLGSHRNISTNDLLDFVVPEQVPLLPVEKYSSILLRNADARGSASAAMEENAHLKQLVYTQQQQIMKLASMTTNPQQALAAVGAHGGKGAFIPTAIDASTLFAGAVKKPSTAPITETVTPALTPAPKTFPGLPMIAPNCDHVNSYLMLCELRIQTAEYQRNGEALLDIFMKEQTHLQSQLLYTRAQFQELKARYQQARLELDLLRNKRSDTSMSQDSSASERSAEIVTLARQVDELTTQLADEREVRQALYDQLKELQDSVLRFRDLDD